MAGIIPTAAPVRIDWNCQEINRLRDANSAIFRTVRHCQESTNKGPNLSEIYPRELAAFRENAMHP